MRMSCNGCRVLRKGCSENCSIRPCLQWIKTPESQANATVFLAKFYGRAGLMNLINSGPEHLRPAIFRSLLYEACGRIVNPIYGSVGLLWSGSWQLCQSAVEAVLKGAPIVQIPSDQAAVNSPNLPLIKAYDIRHVSKDEPNSNNSGNGGVGGGGATHPHHELHKVVRTRSRGFKRSSAASSSSSEAAAVAAAAATLANAKHHKTESNRGWNRRELSHESSTTDELSEPNSRETQTESMFSVETVEASLVSRAAEPKRSEDCQSDGGDEHESEVELELTLGFETTSRVNHHHRVGQVSERKSINGGGFDTCKMELGLDYPA